VCYQNVLGPYGTAEPGNGPCPSVVAPGSEGRSLPNPDPLSQLRNLVSKAGEDPIALEYHQLHEYSVSISEMETKSYKKEILMVNQGLFSSHDINTAARFSELLCSHFDNVSQSTGNGKIMSLTRVLNAQVTHDYRRIDKDYVNPVHKYVDFKAFIKLHRIFRKILDGKNDFFVHRILEILLGLGEVAVDDDEPHDPKIKEFIEEKLSFEYPFSRNRWIPLDVINTLINAQTEQKIRFGLVRIYTFIYLPVVTQRDNLLIPERINPETNSLVYNALDKLTSHFGTFCAKYGGRPDSIRPDEAGIAPYYHVWVTFDYDRLNRYVGTLQELYTVYLVACNKDQSNVFTRIQEELQFFCIQGAKDLIGLKLLYKEIDSLSSLWTDPKFRVKGLATQRPGPSHTSHPVYRMLQYELRQRRVLLDHDGSNKFFIHKRHVGVLPVMKVLFTAVYIQRLLKEGLLDVKTTRIYVRFLHTLLKLDKYIQPFSLISLRDKTFQQSFRSEMGYTIRKLSGHGSA
jgi:hypothetical protein